MSERKNEYPEMMTAENLQNFGFTRSMAYAFLNCEDVPIIRIGKRKFIRKEKFYEWLEKQERSGDKN